MAVPAHDNRDNEFALKYGIDIRWVVTSNGEMLHDSSNAYSGEGVLVNSSSEVSGLDINGLLSKEAASKVTEWATKTGNGKKKVHAYTLNERFALTECRIGLIEFSSLLSLHQVNYKLRDWLFARQRYWGEPIPIVFLEDTEEGVPIQESELPLTLPELDDFSPSGSGEPPLSKAESWVNCLFILSIFCKENIFCDIG